MLVLHNLQATGLEYELLKEGWYIYIESSFQNYISGKFYIDSAGESKAGESKAGASKSCKSNSSNNGSEKTGVVNFDGSPEVVKSGERDDKWHKPTNPMGSRLSKIKYFPCKVLNWISAASIYNASSYGLVHWPY